MATTKKTQTSQHNKNYEIACIVVGLTRSSGYVAVGLLAMIAAATVTDLASSGPATVAMIAGCVLVCGLFLARDAERGDQLAMIADAFVVGAKYAIAVGAAAASVGIIIGVVTLTGVGFKISNIVTSYADALAVGLHSFAPLLVPDVKTLTLFFTLVMTAIVCILLGCGVPTTATYIIMVTVAAPALSQLGMEPIVAHFFVFYYGVIADITPPVAMAAYAAASMAGAEPFRTGNTAFRLGLAKVLVPFVFAYSPAMLLVTRGFTWAEFWETTLGCAAGVAVLAAGLTGYLVRPMPLWQQLPFIAAGIMMMSPNRISTLAGLAIAAALTIVQFTGRRPGGEARS